MPLCFFCAISTYLGEAFTPCHPRCSTLLSELFQRRLFFSGEGVKTLQLSHEKRSVIAVFWFPLFFAMFYFKLVHFDLFYHRFLGASVFFCLTQNFPQSAVVLSVCVLQNTKPYFFQIQPFLRKEERDAPENTDNILCDQ